MSNFIFLKNFASVLEADLAKNLLEAYGVKCMIQKGRSGSRAHSGYAGEGDLFVQDFDVEKARTFLDNKK
jgi:hypothetical protein